MGADNPYRKNISKVCGLLFVFLFASTLWGQEIMYPEGSIISTTYSISELIVETGSSLTITRTITNNESYPLTNLYVSESISPELELISYSIDINGTVIPFAYFGDLEDEIIAGYKSFYWVIDEPIIGDTLNRNLMPGETLNLEYSLSSTVSGSYAVMFHTTCFYGDGTGYFAVGDSTSVAFVSDPECGDTNSDGEMDILDVVYLINYRYKSGPPPDPMESGDVNHDGSIDILDIVYIINFVYKSGPEPLCPDPASL